MIYEIYLDDKLIHYPGDVICSVYNPKMEMALNDAGSLEFDVPPNHPEIDSFNPRRSMLKVIKVAAGTETEVFYGEVREVTQNLDFTKHIYAVGELAFLFDSIQPQARYQGTPLEMITAMLNQHNAQVEERKRFTLGMVETTDPYIYHFTNREDTLTAFRDKLCDTLGLFLRIRKIDGTRYLDFVSLENYGRNSKQVIEFGENMLDYSSSLTANDIATAVLPLGATLDENQRTPEAIEGLDEYVTIKSVNEGVDYIYSETAVANFGMVKVVKKWDDVTLPENLKEKAEEWLESAQFATLTLEINAFDLSIMNLSIDSFEIGDRVRALAEPFGMDTVFPIQKKTTYLMDHTKNYVVLGNTQPLSYTAQASKAASSIEEKIPQESPLLDKAKANALRILEGAEGGCVVFGTNADGQIERLMILDNIDPTQALKKWEWNINGFGYMTRDATTEEWTNLGVAITMDGSIVADYITAGDLNCDRLNGGVINGQVINGGTIDGAVITSAKEDAGDVKISGGSIILKDTPDNYLKVQANDDAERYITLGSRKIACRTSGAYIEMDTWDALKYIYDHI